MVQLIIIKDGVGCAASAGSEAVVRGGGLPSGIANMCLRAQFVQARLVIEPLSYVGATVFDQIVYPVTETDPTV